MTDEDEDMVVKDSFQRPLLSWTLLPLIIISLLVRGMIRRRERKAQARVVVMAGGGGGGVEGSQVGTNSSLACRDTLYVTGHLKQSVSQILILHWVNIAGGVFIIRMI